MDSSSQIDSEKQPQVRGMRGDGSTDTSMMSMLEPKGMGMGGDDDDKGKKNLWRSLL